MEELRSAAADPQRVMRTLSEGLGPAARRLAIGRLKPAVAPHAASLGVEWLTGGTQRLPRGAYIRHVDVWSALEVVYHV